MSPAKPRDAQRRRAEAKPSTIASERCEQQAERLLSFKRALASSVAADQQRLAALEAQQITGLLPLAAAESRRGRYRQATRR